MAKVAFLTPFSNEALWEELLAIIEKTSWLVFSHIAFFSCLIFDVAV